MEDLADEKNSGEKKPASHLASGGSTGPRSAVGKAISSMNAVKHGCRSAKTLLRHEDPSEFDALMNAWFCRYQPRDPVFIALVEETARAHWLLRRARKRLEDVEWELPMNAFHWSDTYQALYANFLRYKTTAERSFLRFYRELETWSSRNQVNKQSLATTAFAAIGAIEQQCMPQPPSIPAPDASSSPQSADSKRHLDFSSFPEPAFLIPPQLPFAPAFVEPEAET